MTFPHDIEEREVAIERMPFTRSEKLTVSVGCIVMASALCIVAAFSNWLPNRNKNRPPEQQRDRG